MAHETIAFATAQCVGYHETFASGAGRDGAYVCQFSITAPEFELRSGGPAAAILTRAIGGNGDGVASYLPSPDSAVSNSANLATTAATAADAAAAVASNRKELTL